MRDLRRDLFERRMWPLLVALLVAIIAVPALLSRGDSSPTPTAAAAVPTEPASAAPSAHATAERSSGHRDASASGRGGSGRDPFSSSAAPRQTQSVTTSTMSSVEGSGSSASSSVSAGSATAVATHSISSAAGLSGHQTESAAVTHPTTTRARSTSTVAHVSDSAGAHRQTSARQSRSWTIYRAAVSYGEKGDLRRLSNLARLTPLPSATVPEALFDGMTAGGRDAVFQLALGVTPSGPALCRPSRRLCTAIILPVHAVETLKLAPSSGPSTVTTLEVTRVQATVTHSVATAVAALERVSALGVCELSMANSVAFDPETLTATAPRSARCARGRKLMPFLGIGGA